MKTFKQFIAETDLAALGADISAKAKTDYKKNPRSNTPVDPGSQSEPKAPTNIAPAVASTVNSATGGYAGHLLRTAQNAATTATKQVVGGALGAK